VTASASDNVGVTSVGFYVDGTLKSTDSASPYSFAWDTTTYAAGSHTIYSKAYDAAGNVGTSTTITVTVDNSVVGQMPSTTRPQGAEVRDVGLSCDSGASLLLGRATKGPSPAIPTRSTAVAPTDVRDVPLRRVERPAEGRDQRRRRLRGGEDRDDHGDRLGVQLVLLGQVGLYYARTRTVPAGRSSRR